MFFLFIIRPFLEAPGSHIGGRWVCYWLPANPSPRLILPSNHQLTLVMFSSFFRAANRTSRHIRGHHFFFSLFFDQAPSISRPCEGGIDRRGTRGPSRLPSLLSGCCKYDRASADTSRPPPSPDLHAPPAPGCV